MNYSNQSKTVLKYANQVGKSLGASSMDSQHLLYGLAKCKDSVSGSILLNHGVTANDIKKTFETRMESIPKIATRGKLPMTPQVELLINDAEELAEDMNQKEVGTEHLLYAIVMDEKSLAFNLLGYLLKDGKKGIEQIARELEVLLDLNDEGDGPEEFVRSEEISTADNTQKFNLEDYTKNLNETAQNSDAIIGREEETERLIQVLSRRTKNNPCLIGQPGVGKTAIVEGLAQRISNGRVPYALSNKKILILDMSSIVAGTQYRGEFEKRMKAIIEEVSKDKTIILFMDEIHTLIGAGSAKGTLDAANILKPALSRGEIQIIGATTEEEFRKYFEKDAALERRFQPISVKEPTVPETIEILKGIAQGYEDFHNVSFTEEAIEACAVLSERYITDRRLPDKAIDVMDEAATMRSLEGSSPDGKIGDLKKRIAGLDDKLREAVLNENFEEALEIRRSEDVLFEEIKKVENQSKSKNVSHKKEVNIHTVEKVVSRWSKVPVSEFSQKESQRLLNLEKNLHKRIIGQNEAVEAVSKAIRRGRVGLSDPKRPIGSFVFLGPTGVGKTELSKALAECVFGSEDSLIRIDMSEYMEQHSVSKILGSPPGYVGFEEGGQLSERVRKNPYSVILFDEVEKAHPDVFNVLLQILDDGQVTDSQGRKVNFKNTVIIMTSNVGAKRITEPKNLGFVSNESEKQNYDKMKSNVMEEVKQLFKPEFINRIDDFIVFKKLDEKNLTDITKLLLSNLAGRAKTQMGIEISFADSLTQFIVKKYSDPLMGARPLKRGITQNVEDALSEEILSGRLSSGDKVKVSYKGEKVTFTK